MTYVTCRAGFSSGYSSCLKNNNHIEHWHTAILNSLKHTLVACPHYSASGFDICTFLFAQTLAWLLATLVSYSHSSIKVLLHNCSGQAPSLTAAMNLGPLIASNSSMQNCSNALPPGWSTCCFSVCAFDDVRPQLIPALCLGTLVLKQKMHCSLLTLKIFQIVRTKSEVINHMSKLSGIVTTTKKWVEFRAVQTVVNKK